MADAPDPGTYNLNTNAQASQAGSHAGVIGQLPSEIKQNGSWVASTQATSGTDTPGSRGALV